MGEFWGNPEEGRTDLDLAAYALDADLLTSAREDVKLLQASARAPLARVIHTRYYAGNQGILPVLVVAAENKGTVGSPQNWAAYIGGLHHYGEPTPADLERIRTWGTKLTEEQARGHFPNLYGTNYRA